MLHKRQSNEKPVTIRRGERGVDGNAIRGMVCRVGLDGRPRRPHRWTNDTVGRYGGRPERPSPHPPNHPRPYGILDARLRLIPIGRPCWAPARDAQTHGPYKWPPVIRIPSCSSVASGDTISTICPSYMTAMRSDSERISSSSAETSSTALPASRTSIRRR
jgi:hypothetical protein